MRYSWTHGFWRVGRQGRTEEVAAAEAHSRPADTFCYNLLQAWTFLGPDLFKGNFIRVTISISVHFWKHWLKGVEARIHLLFFRPKLLWAQIYYRVISMWGTSISQYLWFPLLFCTLPYLLCWKPVSPSPTWGQKNCKWPVPVLLLLILSEDDVEWSWYSNCKSMLVVSLFCWQTCCKVHPFFCLVSWLSICWNTCMVVLKAYMTPTKYIHNSLITSLTHQTYPTDPSPPQTHHTWPRCF